MSQEIVPLWPESIPNQESSSERESIETNDIIWITNVQNPTLEIYLPTKKNATGMAVIVCPGGGYSGLAYDWEGTDVAKWLNAKGIAAFVLKYRLPISSTISEPHKVPLMDAVRAIRMVRANASSWNIDQGKVGIMGYSAGGHLASTLSTHYNTQQPTYDEMDGFPARPDFTILIYPVISMMAPYVHTGSRDNLIGKGATKEMKELYSNELQVTENTPPTFLIHSSDDGAVHVMNSLLYYQALQKNDVYSELHVYPEGGHGYSFAIGDEHLSSWPDRLHDWLKTLYRTK